MMTMMMTARSSRRPPAGIGGTDSVQFVGERLVGDDAIVPGLEPRAEGAEGEDEDGSSAEECASTVPGHEGAYVRSGASISRECEELWGEAFSREEKEQLLPEG